MTEEGRTGAAERIARLFHETYERLAPSFGYETRKESAVPWADVPEQNRVLMVAVAREVEAALRADGGLLQHYQDLAVERAAETEAAEARLEAVKRHWMDKYDALFNEYEAAEAERDRLRDALNEINKVGIAGQSNPHIIARRAEQVSKIAAAALEGQGGEA